MDWKKIVGSDIFCAKKDMIVKYGIINGITTLLYIVLYNVLILWDTKRYIVANIVAYCLSIILGYILTKRFVFCVKKESIKQVVLFVLGRAVLVTLNSVLLWILYEAWGIDLRVSQVVATATMFALSYLVNKKIFLGLDNKNCDETNDER